MHPCVCEVDNCALCEAHLFADMRKDQVCEVRGVIHRHRYPRHQALFREGEPATHIVIIKRGQVKLVTCLADGREQILGVASPGQLVGIEVLNQDNYPYTVVPLTPVDVCRIGYKDLLRVVGNDPEAAVRVIRALTRELEHSRNRIRDLGLRSATERVAAFLLSLSPGQPKSGETVPLALSRLEMGELLGVTEETVSRIMSQLRRAGVIVTQTGQLTIHDPGQLARVAGDESGNTSQNRADSTRSRSAQN
jgi:CRP-like cAMP-binding protein